MIPELMATRERVAWIFHEKARRLHSEANNGKAGPPDLGCLPAGASFIRGGVLPEIGWFSSTREVSVGRGGLYPKAVVSLTWPYACRLFQPPSARSGKLPPRDPLLMNTSRFLAGLFWFLAGSEGLLSCIRSLQQNPLGSEDFFCSFFSRFHVE